MPRHESPTSSHTRWIETLYWRGTGIGQRGVIKRRASNNTLWAVTGFIKKTAVQLEIIHLEKNGMNDCDLIASESKTTGKEMFTNDLSTMVNKLIDDILRNSFHKALSSIPSVVHNVVE